MTYEKRTYRQAMRASDLDYFQVTDLETDLYIGVEKKASGPDLEKILLTEVRNHRRAIYAYARDHPAFIESLLPLKEGKDAPAIVADMLAASRQTGVGPMAAVAGAMVKELGKTIAAFSAEMIIENGGDLLIQSTKTRRVSLYTKSQFFQGLALRVKASQSPLGICTSSGSQGHALSFGKADSVTVISENPALADAAATALGNRINSTADIEAGLNWIKTISGIKGALILINDQLGAWGEIELC